MRDKKIWAAFGLLLIAGLLFARFNRPATADTKVRKKVIVEKVDHFMVCVSNLKQAIGAYSDLFGDEFYPVEPYALDKWGATQAALGASGIELVEAAPTGAAAEFIKRAGEAIVGVAFKTPDLQDAIAGMQARNIRLIAKAEGPTRKVALFHPEDAHGVMIKLVEYLPAYTIADLEVVTAWRKAQGLTPIAKPATEKPRIAAEKIDHIIIYVKEIDKAREFFGELFGTHFPDARTSASSRVKISVEGFLGLELLASTTPELPAGTTPESSVANYVASSVIKFIARRSAPGFSGEGVSAISFKVSNFDESVAALAAMGSKPGATRDLPSRKVALYGPGGGLGAGLELIQYRPFAHPTVALDMMATLRKTPKKTDE